MVDISAINAALANSSASAQPAPAEADAGKVLPPAGSAVPEKASVEPAKVSLDRVLESLDAYLSSSQRSLRFRVDDSSGRTVITVLDPVTNQVVRQIPSDEALAIARNLEQTSSGLLSTKA